MIILHIVMMNKVHFAMLLLHNVIVIVLSYSFIYSRYVFISATDSVINLHIYQ